MVDYNAWSFCSDIITQRQDHVANGKLARFSLPFSVLLLHSGDLISELLNSSLEFD